MQHDATFTSEDHAQFAQRQVRPEAAAAQLELLRNPPPAIVLERPATAGDGIVRLTNDQQAALIDRGDAAAAAGRVMKFVPASGAATRMFKDLIAALADPKLPSHSPAAREFFERLDSFPFANELRRLSGVSGMPRDEGEERALLRTMLETMEYAKLPKGLIPFHRTAGEVRTAFVEQLLEGTRYARADDETCRMHFTVAPEWRDEFERSLGEAAPKIEARRRGTRLDVTFSEQHPSTDTLASGDDGQPFRTADGALLFRPGGHGALLHNLDASSGDIVVVKNIDNILPDESSAEVVRWKRVLIGLLTGIQHEAHEFLAACASDAVAEPLLDRGIAFAMLHFSRQPASALTTREEKRAWLIDALDRPLRVCGVVKNEGEPGGAPFWVRAQDGSSSVQIVESSQVDMKSADQVRIFKSSTHFNPVDIICALRSHDGRNYELDRFVDRSAVFMSRKSHEGRDLTALELPGLWNGAMAFWNTICVEVPASTFAPVKTVFDLLRPQHQASAAQVETSVAAQPEGRVLVVEDSPVNQKILQQILRSAGLDVRSASDGERALEILREEAIDLALLDIVLPGLDGYEILARMRSDSAMADVPVIFISALDEVSDKVRGLGLGAADYVAKPFNKEEVLARVRAQLRIRQLTHSLSVANHQLRDKQEVLSLDLRAAADIQKALLPDVDLALPGIASASVFQPSLEIGGDIFNVVPLPDGRVAIYIADVSGHGVASALLTVSVTQRLSGISGMLDGTAESPATLLRQLEQEYPFERFGKYFSLVLALVDPRSGEIRYSSAGHPPPFIVRANGAIVRLERGGPVLGMGFDLGFEEGTETLREGDRLVLYTDGVTDDEDTDGNPFGFSTLATHFAASREEPLRVACLRLLDVLKERRGDAPPADDIAVLAIEKS